MTAPRRAAILRALALAVVLLAALGVRLRIGADWAFAGSDSYGYMGIADQLHRDLRYALGPPPEPLSYARPPLYPLFLATLLVDDTPNWPRRGGTQNWRRMQVAQSILEVLGLGLVAYALARRFAGFAVALVAVALVLFWPPTIVMSNMIMPEWLATVLTLAVMLLVVVAGASRRRWLALGALVAVAFLVRIDSLLLAAPCLAALAFVHGWRARLTLGALALAGFCVVVAPWALRNLVRFGSPHLAVEGLDYQSRPADISGFRTWMATWAYGLDELKRYAFCFTRRGCPLSVEKFPRYAFSDELEREIIASLLWHHNREGYTEELSRGFATVASVRRHRRPFERMVELPLERALTLWLTPADDLHRARKWRPWPALFDPLWPRFYELGRLLLLALVLALVALAIAPATRQLAIVAAAAIAVRTLALAWAYYPEPRYLFEVTPLALVVITLGAATSARLLFRALRRH